MLNILSLVRYGACAMKSKMDRRKRLPKERKLTWLDKTIVLLSGVLGYSFASKAVPFIEGKLLDT